jgi:16S rRNA (cytosine1402-N4)-methyltransferase
MQPSAATPQNAHKPVLYEETLVALAPQNGGRYIDATLGAGGHAQGILEASAPTGSLLGLDLDPQAIQIASARLEKYGKRVHIQRRSYTGLLEAMRDIGWEAVDGVLFDLGVSSMQLDNPRGGFSFKTEAPLDMRFDPQNDISADTLVNHLPEKDLAEIIWKYGEEKASRKIANAICAARPVKSTTGLAAIVRKAIGKASGKVDPATRTFQAIRIAVNSELQAVEETLPKAVEALVPGGRLAVITFHSLEDRLVKQYLRRESSDCICPPGQPVCTCGHKATLKELNRKGVTASEAEIKSNPRSRSARLRAAQKVALA